MGVGLGNSMGVSKKKVVPPKSSILIGFSLIINHPFWGVFPTIFGNIHMGIVWGPRGPMSLGVPENHTESELRE